MERFLIKHLVELIFIIFSFFCFTAYSKPAKPGMFKYVQPDGSTILLTVKGDWQTKVYYTADGQPVSKGADGFYRTSDNDFNRKECGKSSASGDMLDDNVNRRMKGPGRFNENFPVYGEQKVLVVLVNFTDCEFTQEDPADFYSRMLNEEGFCDYGSSGSARDYFVSNSRGLFSPSFDVFGPVTLSHERGYYGKNSVYGNEKHAYEMIIEACRLIDKDVDFSEYDRDGDGTIDNVYVYYAGYGEADSYMEDTVWPHSWFITLCTNEKHFFDGVRLDRYACSNEMDYGQGRPDGIGTFVHEFSHVMGLPDLYQTDGGYGSFTPGQWSVMDVGSYNDNGLTPPNYSSFERYALGWSEPETICQDGAYVLPDFGISNKAYMIPTKREGEFFLFENRQNEGYDTYLPGHGMLVWHIDYDMQSWLSNGVNNDALHQRVDLVEADGLQTARSRAGDSFPGPDGITSFADNTTPAFVGWNGSSPGFDIVDISENDDGTISFNVTSNNAFVVSADSDFNGIGIEGNAIRCTDGIADVYDLSGRLVANVGNELYILPAGAYIIVCGKNRAKIIVR